MEDHIIQFFSFAHLPERLQKVSAPFAELAGFITTLPRHPERTVALRKLLESKDAAVRAFIAKEKADPVPVTKDGGPVSLDSAFIVDGGKLPAGSPLVRLGDR